VDGRGHARQIVVVVGLFPVRVDLGARVWTVDHAAGE
jgi:hypothetical protein